MATKGPAVQACGRCGETIEWRADTGWASGGDVVCQHSTTGLHDPQPEDARSDG